MLWCKKHTKELCQGWHSSSYLMRYEVKSPKHIIYVYTYLSDNHSHLTIGGEFISEQRTNTSNLFHDYSPSSIWTNHEIFPWRINFTTSLSSCRIYKFNNSTFPQNRLANGSFWLVKYSKWGNVLNTIYMIGER